MKKAQLKIVTMNVKDLLEKKAQYNPREMSIEEKNGLMFSMEKFGYVQNIIYNKRTDRIISGHQRIDILNQQKYETVDVHVVDLSEEDEKKLNIVMNSPTVAGTFTPDVSELLEEMMELDPEFYDMTNLVKIMFEDFDKEKEKEEPNQSTEIVEGLKLLPYESYDCILVVCKRRDDFMFLSSMLELSKRRVISSPMVKSKKYGFVRAVNAKDLIRKIKSERDEIDTDIDEDVNILGGDDE